jgi:hypothetical protein
MPNVAKVGALSHFDLSSILPYEKLTIRLKPLKHTFIGDNVKRLDIRALT